MDHADIRISDDLDGLPPWCDPDWSAAAEAWITESCEAAGLARTGPGTLRGRMWSAVARIPVEGGCVWFKENSPRSGFEPALVDALSRWSPRDAPPLITADVERRRALTRDVGERLDGLLKRDPDLRNLHMPLRRYAQLQQSLAARVEDLFALGVPDGRPEHIEELLDDILTYAPSGLISEDVLRHVKATLPELRAWGRQLAALGAPITIDHQDLHPGNILGTSADSRPFDWGDSVVGSAFGSILVILRATPEFCSIERDDPGIKALRAVYLERWLESGTWNAAELDEAVELSLRLTPVIKAHVWTRMFPCFRRSAKPWKSVAFWLGNIGCEDPVTVGLA
jgi:hypothetical protein